MSAKSGKNITVVELSRLMGSMCRIKTLTRKDIFSIIHAEISGKSALKMSNEMNKADAILELLKLEKLVHASKTEGLTIFVKLL